MTISISDPQLQKPKGNQPRRGSTASYYRCFQNYYHAHKYLQPNPHYISNVKSSVNHWQLRDLVQIDSATGQVYHTYDDAIRTLLVLPRNATLVKSRDYLRLPYFPRCFNHTSGGLVVAGGVITSLSKVFSMDVPDLTRGTPGTHTKPLKGLFSFYGGVEPEQTFKLGEMINNAVTIYPKNGAYTSYVCNNDSNLYIVDISTRGVQANRKFVCEPSTSLNNVHQLPDGRLLTATGDSSSIFLLDPNMAQPEIQTIKTAYDSGFGISYHNDEHTLAAAFQDGACLLYDLRKLGPYPLHEVKSTRPGHQSGAFRCCKFLQSPIQDLLVILEHVGRVHLIDLRDLDKDNHQVLVFPFALNQFSHYKHDMLSVREKLLRTQKKDFEEDDPQSGCVDTHKRFEIFDEETAHFSAPLVYDYKYLTEENPKLFKEYVYQPPQMPLCEPELTVPPELNHPQWNSAPVSFNAECEPGSFNESNDGLSPRGLASVDPHDVRVRLDLEVRVEEECPPPQEQSLRFLCHDSYQQSVNHIHGEMELSGLDWFDNQLYIGCEDGGLVAWDVNVHARRSMGSFSFV